MALERPSRDCDARLVAVFPVPIQGHAQIKFANICLPDLR